MSWQAPRGGGGSGFNPNAGSFVPGGGRGGFAPAPAGGYYPQQQPGGGYGGAPYGQQQPGGGYGGGYYPPQQPGGVYGGGYYPQQQPGVYGGAPYGQQQPGGGYGRGGGGGAPGAIGGAVQPTVHIGPAIHADPATAGRGAAGAGAAAPGGSQAPPAKPVAKASPADAAKLQLGGVRSAEPIVMPKKKGGGKLVIGGKKEEPKKEEEAMDAGASGKKEEAGSAGEEKAASSGASPTQAEPTPAAGAAKADSGATDGKSVGALAQARKKRGQKEYVRDPRPHLNVVFCGHVDAGKSTISGHLMADQGVVDEREVAKLMREAQQNNREGWGYAYVFDVSEEERAKGKTHETGSGYFETKDRRVTVLDAPGHKAFVPSMIGGAAQADCCVLVISARTGEFETGFENGGQTREHAVLVKTCGVKFMVCVVNKMDDCAWSQERYGEITAKLRPFLKENGFDEDKRKNLVFMPVAGLTGANLVAPIEPSVCSWFKGPTLLDYINQLVIPETKSENDVLAVPLMGAYKDDGKVFVYGKVESGSIVVGDELQILPQKVKMVVEGIQVEAAEIEKAYPGDNVHVRVRGIDETDVHPGFVLTEVPSTLRAVDYFQAQIVILEVKNIISAGTKVVMHLHAAQEEVTFHKLLAKIDKKTGAVVEKEPKFVKAGDVVMARLEMARSLVAEPHKSFDRLGRFMLREEGKTIAIGLVTKLYESTRAEIAAKEGPM